MKTCAMGAILHLSVANWLRGLDSCAKERTRLVEVEVLCLKHRSLPRRSSTRQMEDHPFPPCSSAQSWDKNGCIKERKGSGALLSRAGGYERDRERRTQGRGSRMRPIRRQDFTRFSAPRENGAVARGFGAVLHAPRAQVSMFRGRARSALECGVLAPL